MWKAIWARIKAIFAPEPQAEAEPQPQPVPKPVQPSPTGYAVIENSIDYIFENEGGYSNIPEDHGGPTNWGITQEDLAHWRGHPVSADDVKHMSKDEAKLIYKSMYWDRLRLDEVKDQAKATCILDTGVLDGVVTSIKMAELACLLPQNGQADDTLIAAINAADRGAFIRSYHHQLMQRYESIVIRNPSQHRFLAGWTNRTNRLLTLV